MWYPLYGYNSWPYFGCLIGPVVFFESCEKAAIMVIMGDMAHIAAASLVLKPTLWWGLRMHDGCIA